MASYPNTDGRRKFMLPNGKWMSRARTTQEVRHLNSKGEHHPETGAKDIEAAGRFWR